MNGKKLLEEVESMNKTEMFSDLDDDELRRMHNILHVWCDLASREINLRKNPIERIVKHWADSTLYQIGIGRYQLTSSGGQPIGDEIRAATDEEAIQAVIRIERERWEKEREKNGSARVQ